MTPEMKKLIDDNRWQPIETALRLHQTYILGFDHDVGVYNMHWRDEKNNWCYSWNQEPCNPTHWMPLPDNRLAYALEIAVDALDRIKYGWSYEGGIFIDVATEALQKIQAIAEVINDDH